jgi:hypothetical protein
VAVAPAAFRVLPARGLAGDLNGAVLSTMCRLLEGAFAVVFATTWALTRLRPRPRSVVVARRLPVLGFFAAVVTGDLVIPVLEKLRSALPAGGAAGSAARAAFERYHLLSVVFLSVALSCGLALLALSVSFLRDPSEPALSPPPSAVRL